MGEVTRETTSPSLQRGVSGNVTKCREGNFQDAPIYLESLQLQPPRTLLASSHQLTLTSPNCKHRRGTSCGTGTISFSADEGSREVNLDVVVFH